MRAEVQDFGGFEKFGQVALQSVHLLVLQAGRAVRSTSPTPWA